MNDQPIQTPGKSYRRRESINLYALIEQRTQLSDEALIQLKERFAVEIAYINARLIAEAESGACDQGWQKRAIMARQLKQSSIRVCEKELHRRHQPPPTPTTSNSKKTTVKTKDTALANARNEVAKKKLESLKQVPGVPNFFMYKAQTMLSPELYDAIYKQAYAHYLDAFRAAASQSRVANEQEAGALASLPDQAPSVPYIPSFLSRIPWLNLSCF